MKSGDISIGKSIEFSLNPFKNLDLIKSIFKWSSVNNAENNRRKRWVLMLRNHNPL